jgi:uncharacterized protein (DUF2336 family)
MEGACYLPSSDRTSIDGRKRTVFTIRLRVDDFVALAGSRGQHTFEAQAAATGLGIGTIHRLRSGEPASAPAVARIIRAYGVAFDDVFVIDEAGVPAEPKHTGKALAA